MRCYNVEGLLYWLSGDSCSQPGPSLPALAPTTPRRCALVGKVGGWRRSSSTPLVLPSTRSTCCWCVILLLSQMAPLIYLESKTSRIGETPAISVCQCQQSEGCWARETTSVISSPAVHLLAHHCSANSPPFDLLQLLFCMISEYNIYTLKEKLVPGGIENVRMHIGELHPWPFHQKVER